MYMLMELHCGLPWQKEREKESIERIKCNIKDEDLHKHFPSSSLLSRQCLQAN